MEKQRLSVNISSTKIFLHLNQLIMESSPSPTEIALLIIWKYWSHRGATSKCHSLLFGSIGRTEVLLPNVTPYYLEVLVTQMHFLQISSSIFWKYGVPNSSSSKYSSLSFGGLIRAMAVLPNIHPMCLEVWCVQRQFFQIITSRVWKYGLPDGCSSK